MHAKTRGASVSYGGTRNYEFTHGRPPSGRGYWGFKVTGTGATHQVWGRSMLYSAAKKMAVGVAKRVSARTGKHIKVKVLT